MIRRPESRHRRLPGAAGLAALTLLAALLSGAAFGGNVAAPSLLGPGNPTAPLATPQSPDVTRPYLQVPPPSNPNELDKLQMRSYGNQLYWQQQNLQLQQSKGPLTADQQQRLNQTRIESNRVNSQLGPKLTTPLPSPSAGSPIGTPSVIPSH
jgi:hypothetical protein